MKSPDKSRCWANVTVRSSSSQTRLPQPTTQVLPNRWATTAACEVTPPLAVTRPSAAWISLISSGTVSPRARIGYHLPRDMITGEAARRGAFPPLAPPPGAETTYTRIQEVCNRTPPRDIYNVPLDELLSVGALTDVRPVTS